MKVAIQLMILMACFIIVLKQYRRQPQMYLLVTLITLGLLGLTKSMLPWIETKGVTLWVCDYCIDWLCMELLSDSKTRKKIKKDLKTLQKWPGMMRSFFV